jgi:hypothetical protein
MAATKGNPMPDKKLYVRFVRDDISALISLNQVHAPRTCEVLWQALRVPVQIKAMHAMFAGPEIMLGLPTTTQTFDPQAIPPENQTCFPTAGDCLWFYQGKNMMYGLSDELWEVGIFYAAGDRIFGPLGWTPCNIFGRMTENLEAFAAACADIRITGAKTVEIGRWSGA